MTTEKASLPHMSGRHGKRLAATATAVAVLLGGTAIALAAQAAAPDLTTLPSISTSRMQPATTRAPGVPATSTADSSAVATGSTMTIAAEPPTAVSGPSSQGSPTQAETEQGRTGPLPAEESKVSDADKKDKADEDHETVAPPVREDDGDGEDHQEAH